MSKAILVIAAHSDDEVLGCGGTIARHVATGDQVHVVFMADGVKSRSSATSQDLDRRMAAMQRAKAILGYSGVECLGLPDNQMDTLPFLPIVQRLEAVLENVQPSVVYTHHYGDLNIDHRLTHEVVKTACRPLPGSSVREIYGFEVLSSTEWAMSNREPFVPTLFVDISNYLSSKLRALDAYGEEMRPMPHTRSVQHAEILARHRGLCVGVQAAEAFEVYRIIRKERDA